MSEAIYQRPDLYDLEHEGDTGDIEFFVRLAGEMKPRRVLELACGSGRVTLPLAEAGARRGFEVVGLEMVPEMLDRARELRDAAAPDVRSRLTLVEGDMRSWRADLPFDLILTPCSSMCHVLDLDDQLAAWRSALANLAAGGRFVVDVSMPDLPAYVDSFRTPPHAVLEVDRDRSDPDSGERLIRTRTIRYAAHEQRAEIRYIYDRFQGGAATERFISDYRSHVYFPRELHLLFMVSGFTLERLYGDYSGRPLDAPSRQLIAVGRKGL